MLGAATPNGQGAIGVSASEIAQLLNVLQPGFANVGGTSTTLSAAQIVAGHLVSSGGTTPTLTTDTANNIINAMTQSAGATPRIGQTFLLSVANLNSGIATLAAGAGVALVGTATAAASAEVLWIGTITGTSQSGGSPAITLQRAWARTIAA